MGFELQVQGKTCQSDWGGHLIDGVGEWVISPVLVIHKVWVSTPSGYRCRDQRGWSNDDFGLQIHYRLGFIPTSLALADEPVMMAKILNRLQTTREKHSKIKPLFFAATVNAPPTLITIIGNSIGNANERQQMK